MANPSLTSSGLTLTDGTVIANRTNILNMVYPVGSIYITVETGTTGSSSPASFLGGTWTRLTAGCALWTASEGAGNIIAQGLPDIYGKIYCNDGNYSLFNARSTMCSLSNKSAIRITDDNGHSSSGTSSLGNYSRGLEFKASYYNSIYGNSSSVQPPAYKVYAWKRTA